jgi:hypothetical protein
MNNEERYKEALEWLQGRMEFGMNDTVAHSYAASIDRLFKGMEWNEALHLPIDDEEDDAEYCSACMCMDCSLWELHCNPCDDCSGIVNSCGEYEE